MEVQQRCLLIIFTASFCLTFSNELECASDEQCISSETYEHCQQWNQTGFIDQKTLILSLEKALNDSLQSKVEIEQQYVKLRGQCLAWSTWTNCSSTCGTGTITRSRECKGKRNKITFTTMEMEEGICENQKCPGLY